MDLSQQKREMISALKSVAVPEIRKMGFTGSFPHFRKMKENNIQFVSFQFGRSNLVGSFVVEFGYGDMDKLPDWMKELSFEKLNYGYVGNRMRIKPEDHLKDDYWFDYSKFKNSNDYTNLATFTVSLLPSGFDFINQN